MKMKYLLTGALALICALQFSAKAEVKNTTNVTTDNFVSLHYSQLGGYAGISKSMSVHSGALWLERDSRPGGMGGIAFPIDPAQQFPLSHNQLKALIKQINASKILQLVGKYHQENLADGWNETLTLTISNQENKDQSFIIENYGKTAPAGFYTFISYLNQLRDQKSDVAGTTALVTPDNFQSLTLQTFGGIGGIGTTVEINAPKTIPGDKKWAIDYTHSRDKPQHADIDAQECNTLFQLLNGANLPAMNGKHYRQKGLYDGFNTTLTVTLRDGQKFTVTSYGNQAPVGFYKVIGEVKQLQQKHFTGN